MITDELKSKIDKVWEAFWTSGISNPLTVIEQMTYLLFIRRLDELHTAKEQISTAIFTKRNSGCTDYVWFYDMQADGFSFDGKRNPIENNDIPDIVKRCRNLKAESKRKRTDKSFLVPVKEIQDNKYDLSFNRYKELVYEEQVYEKPDVIIGRIETLDKERADLLKQLKAMLSE